MTRLGRDSTLGRSQLATPRIGRVAMLSRATGIESELARVAKIGPMLDTSASPTSSQEADMNPYLHPVWSEWICGAHHGGAQALQNLAVHLYNSREWPVNLGYICSMSDDHWEAALVMILDYRENGEKNREFMTMCEEIAEERSERAAAADARDDESRQDMPDS